jgi:hypothetical protein
MMRRALAPAMLLAAAMSLPACQPGSGGPLEPVEGADVRIEADRVALLSDGGLETRVTGRWSSIGANSLRIRYHNGGATPLRIPLAGTRMRHSLGEAVLHTAIDVTGVDMTDAREDNNQGKTLFSLDGRVSAGVLDVPAGATREIDADLTSFPNEGSVTHGDRIAVTVPLVTRRAEVAFNAARPSGLL